MKSEGFINISETFYDGFSGVVLTSKGFTVLNASPTDALIQNTKKASNMAEAIKNTLKTGKNELIKSAISESIKLSMKLLSRAERTLHRHTIVIIFSWEV